MSKQIQALREKYVVSLDDFNTYQIDKLRLENKILHIVNVVKVNDFSARYIVFYTELEYVFETNTGTTSHGS